jgi:hypothetical protein
MPRPAPDGFTFDIAFALIRALKIPKAMRGVRRGITEDERRMMAQAIAAHLMLANWDIRRGAPAGPPTTPDDWSPHGRGNSG